VVQGQPGEIVYETPIFKMTRAKWTGGMTQAVECQLCKREALSSNSHSEKPLKDTTDYCNKICRDLCKKICRDLLCK
jgi:hypothetical protein